MAAGAWRAAVTIAIAATVACMLAILPSRSDAAGASLTPAMAPVSAGVELLMVELPHCGFCARWKAEVLPVYAQTAQGRAAPLRIVQFDGPWPDGLALDSRPVGTPTFILVRGGMELSRLEGYAGADDFMSALAAMLTAAGVAGH